MSVLAAYIVPHPPILLPEVGRGEERKIAHTAASFRETARRIAARRPDTIVVVSPHATLYADYFHISPGRHAQGDLSRFGVRGVSVTAAYDETFARALSTRAAQAGLPAGTEGEREPRLDHGTLIPLRFINEQYTDYRLVRVGLSGQSPLAHYRLGQCIAQTAADLGRRVVLIASGDLSHKLTEDGPYGFAPEGPDFDREVTAAMASGDFLRFLTFDSAFCENAAECGLRAFQILAGTLDGKAVSSELLSYEGPFGVGYGVAAFEVAGDDPSRCFAPRLDQLAREKMERLRTGEDAYVRLARHSLETYVRTGARAAVPMNLPAPLREERAGVFVSLKKDGELRGCIGTIAPAAGSIAEEIVHNAVSAGCEDPRFPRVREDELPALVYSVDVLAPPEPIDSPDELDVRRYGVIVASGRRRGLLLPNLAGVDTVAQQIDIARQKAGIGPDESYTLERFEVVRHK
ncbi:MAG: AmmeMemoRadiSam system protein A [Intestinibacillus sp.]